MFSWTQKLFSKKNSHISVDNSDEEKIIRDDEEKGEAKKSKVIGIAEKSLKIIDEAENNYSIFTYSCVGKFGLVIGGLGVTALFVAGLTGWEGTQGIVPFWHEKSANVTHYRNLWYSSSTDPIPYQQGKNNTIYKVYKCDDYLKAWEDMYGKMYTGKCIPDREVCPVIRNCKTELLYTPCTEIYEKLDDARCVKPPPIPTLFTCTPAILCCIACIYAIMVETRSSNECGNIKYNISDLDYFQIRSLYDNYKLLGGGAELAGKNDAEAIRNFKQKTIREVQRFFKAKLADNLNTPLLINEKPRLRYGS